MEKLQRAKYLALLILRWHQKFGETRALELEPQIAHRYLMRLASIQILNLNEPEDMREIANEQIKGVFEHFYSERIPEILWNEPILQNIPENLGTAASLILHLLKNSEHSEEPAPIFTLPEGWQDTPLLLYPAAVQIPRKSGETVSRTLQSYFASLPQMNDIGLGGCELMVAMNEDHGERENIATNHVTAYNPASFSFQLATGEDTLVTLVLQGKIRLGEIVLGASSSNQDALQREV